MGIRVLPERGSEQVRSGEWVTNPMGKRSSWITIGVLGVAVVVGILIWLVAPNQTPKDASAGGIHLMPFQAENDKQEVSFALVAHDATHVSVLGDFNLWEPTALSDAEGDGMWKTSILLLPGRYAYAFVIDGRWWGQDPQADEYVWSFGDYVSVIYVGIGDGS